MDMPWDRPKIGSRVHLHEPGGSLTTVAPNPHRKRAIAKMRSPYEMHIICIDITNKCDLACSNCTRLLENQDTFWDMTPENFRLAVRSLDGFPGVIAIIGGNPAMHRNFKELCDIFVKEVPNKNQRGLWTNNIFKHSDLAKKVFGVFNLNPHGSERGIKSLAALRSRPPGWYHQGHSSHSPLLTAGKDLFEEEEMWDRISKCDINQEWSASIVQNKGKLRAYFCEVAASFDLARGTDNGIEVVPGWWRRSISEFEDQVAHFCPGCGVPAKLTGHMDYEEIDTYTESNEDLALKSWKKNRKIIKFSESSKSSTLDHKVTQYSEYHFRTSAWLNAIDSLFSKMYPRKQLHPQTSQAPGLAGAPPALDRERNAFTQKSAFRLQLKLRITQEFYRELAYLRQINYELRRSLKRPRRPGG